MYFAHQSDTDRALTSSPTRKPIMFRLLRLVIILGLGIAIGIWFERALMKSECKAGEGQWTGTICVNSELLQ